MCVLNRAQVLTHTEALLQTFKELAIRGQFVHRLVAALIIRLCAQVPDSHADRAVCPAAINANARERKAETRKKVVQQETRFRNVRASVLVCSCLT